MRARTPHQKELRRSTILAAAAALVVKGGWPAVRMEAVAAAAGVAKGTPYLYWETRESLFLELLSREYTHWWQAVREGLPGVAPTAEAVAELLVDTLLPRSTLLALAGALHVVLEANASAEAVVAFKGSLLSEGLATSEALSRHLPGVSPAAAAVFLVRAHAAVVAYRPMSEPPPVVAAVLSRPEFAPLVVEFSPALRSLFRDLLWAAARSTP